MAEKSRLISYIRGVRGTTRKILTPLQRLARYALFHGRGWAASSVPASVTTIFPKFRQRQMAKLASFKIRKLARFTTWHSGTDASVFTARMATRARSAFKKASYQYRKLTRFALFHGRGWAASQVQSYGLIPTRSGFRRRFRAASYQLRKLARFTTWHTGATPPPPPAGAGINYLKARYRKPWLKTPWQYLKLARYAFFPVVAGEEGDFGTGAAVLPFNAPLTKTRVRKQAARSSFTIRKLARFSNWHTGFAPLVPSVLLVKAKTRPRRIVKTSFQWKKQAHFFPLQHTGKTFTVGKFLTRERKIRPLASYQFRKQAHFYQWHTGFFPPPPPTTGENWVSLHGAYRMRRPVVFSH